MISRPAKADAMRGAAKEIRRIAPIYEDAIREVMFETADKLEAQAKSLDAWQALSRIAVNITYGPNGMAFITDTGKGTQ